MSIKRRRSMERVIPLRKTSITPELTDAQEKFWKLLQEDTNRALSIIKLCEKAGYRTKTPWYDAIRDETFRAKLEALGVMIQRAVTYKGMIELAQDAEEEWAKDVIDMRRLVADYPKHMGAGHFRLNFSCIRNPG